MKTTKEEQKIIERLKELLFGETGNRLCIIATPQEISDFLIKYGRKMYRNGLKDGYQIKNEVKNEGFGEGE